MMLRKLLRLIFPLRQPDAHVLPEADARAELERLRREGEGIWAEHYRWVAHQMRRYQARWN